MGAEFPGSDARLVAVTTHAEENHFNNMLEAAVVPDKIAYSSVMKAATRAKDVDLAAAYFKRMKDCKMIPSAVAYVTLMRGLLNSGKYDEAFGIFREMQTAGHASNSMDYNDAFTCLWHLKREDEIEPLLQEMLSKKVKLTGTCVTTLQTALGRNAYLDLRQKYQLDAHQDQGNRQIASKIKRKQDAKLENMLRDQMKAKLRRREVFRAEDGC